MDLEATIMGDRLWRCLLWAMVWLLCSAPCQAVRTLHLMYVDPVGSPLDTGARTFKHEVETRSHGDMRVDLLPGGGQSLGELEILQRVRNGDIEMAIVTTAPLGNYSRPMEILDTPFLFRDYDQVYRTLDGAVGRDLLQDLQKSGLRGLEFMDSGFRIFTSNRPLTSLAGLRNKRIRVMQNEVYYNFIRLIGAVPVPSAVNKINDMARKGYIDAADRSYPTYWSFGLNKVQRYVLETRHAYAAEAMLINDAAYRSMNPGQQGIVLTAARTARDAQRRAFRQNESDVRAKCRRDGIHITVLSEADRTAMRQACAPIYARLTVQYAGLMRQLAQR